LEIEKAVHAMARSHAERRWVTLGWGHCPSPKFLSRQHWNRL